MIPERWHALIKLRAEGYPVFRARDLEPDVTNARHLIAAWRNRGDVIPMAYGYHLLAAAAGAVEHNIDVAAHRLATARFGHYYPTLCTLSAARIHGVGGLDQTKATVAVPLATRAVTLYKPRGSVNFRTRAEQVVGTRNVTLEEGDLDLSGATAIEVTTANVGGMLVSLTTPEQTALDPIHDPWGLEDKNQLLECLRTLAPQCDAQRLSRIAFDQRRRRALTTYTNEVPLLFAWRL